MHLLEKFTDKDTAIWASKYFALDVTRHSQSPFAIFNGQKEHEDLEVRRIQEFIEQNFHERILVDDLAERFSLSRRTLERRFLKATSNSLSEYIQRVRIEAAKKELEGGRNSVQDVMYAVGYSDENAFRRLFQRVTGKSPLKYRDTYAG